MTANILVSELSTLVHDAKKKFPELRLAAEKSLDDLKGLPRTSEAQLAADLKRRADFVKPFLLASETRNAKIAAVAVTGLQRLIVANALPRETLEATLEALRESSTLASDIQLKVLQALPSLLQNYADSLTGPLLVTAFQVSFLLYSSKTAVVSNTAAAALQQLVSSCFDRLSGSNEQSNVNGGYDEASNESAPRSGGAAEDSHHVLEDICLLTDGRQPKSLVGASIAQNFGLELLGSILTNHVDTIAAYPGHIQILRVRLMPIILKLLSEKISFPTTVRAMRILHTILSRLLFALSSECEMALDILNRMLDGDPAIMWKRVLCLELFRNLYSEATLVRSLYAHYDQAEGKRSIIRDNLSCIVRLASEKPAIIGLGQTSSVPDAQHDDSGDQAAVQAGSLVGSIGASVNTIDIDTPGISGKWSNIKVPCIDMLDKSEAPRLPVTYVHSLALTCITTFAEGLARFMLPFTVPTEGRSKRKSIKAHDVESTSQPNASDNATQSPQALASAPRKTLINPMSLKDHVLYSQILTSADMVEHCWPALLAASSTYLKATIDSEYYHGLVRSFQKFTQIAGLLGLITPRDAFLTTLGKNAIPLTATSRVTGPSSMNSHDDESSGPFNAYDGPLANKSNTTNKRTEPPHIDIPIIDARHLLCLRALLNLGIALGPVLRGAWFIILEALQEVDLIISLAGPLQPIKSDPARRQSSSILIDHLHDLDDLAIEKAAVDTAAARMFESTSDLPTDAFIDHIQCLCTLLPSDNPLLLANASTNALSPVVSIRKHQKLRSISGAPMRASSTEREPLFIIEKLESVIANNTRRLSQADAAASGWNVLSQNLIRIAHMRSAGRNLRVGAASVLNAMAVQIATAADSPDERHADILRDRCFGLISSTISVLNCESNDSLRAADHCEEEIHARALEATQMILEQCGETLKTGWTRVFTIVNSAFVDEGTSGIAADSKRSSSATLVRSSFGSLQLICSDFLGYVPASSLLQLLDTLFAFSAQQQDMNISLTSATFFHNVSDYLLKQYEHIDLEYWLTREVTAKALFNAASTGSQGSATAASLWMYLLVHLTQLTVDQRLEVRHSALHTMFRIFDACNGQMTSEAVQVCYNAILDTALRINQEAYTTACSPGPTKTAGSSLNSTAIILIHRIAKTFSSWLEICTHQNFIDEMWYKLFERLDVYLGRETLSVSSAVFDCLGTVLEQLERPDSIPQKSMQKIWDTWLGVDLKVHSDDTTRGEGNEKAILAYLQCLGQLLRLAEDGLNLQQLKITIFQLQSCITGCTASRYNSDIDQMSPVQRKVTETLRAIPTNTPEAVVELLDCIIVFIGLAFKAQAQPCQTEKTYVSLSKASMSSLESFIDHHIRRPGIDQARLLNVALESLRIPIRSKYHFVPEGKAPAPWRKATSVAVAIVEKTENLNLQDVHDHWSASYWEALIDVMNGILSADCEAQHDPRLLMSDQQSDMDAFSRIEKVIIPSLGSSSIPNALRDRYAMILVQVSAIHEFHIEDLAGSGQGPLSGLSSEHIGRVQDLKPSARSKLSYLLLDKLFELVAVQKDDSPQQQQLARATGPYFVLRIGLTLKAYICDQPLRGLMPQPWSEKEEMLYILQQLKQLRSYPQAFDDTPGARSPNHKHLHQLYSLLFRSLRAARTDSEMAQAIADVLEMIGSDFV